MLKPLLALELDPEPVTNPDCPENAPGVILNPPGFFSPVKFCSVW
jgi:hypothetical protein